MAKKTKTPLEIVNDFDSAISDARSIIESVISALYSEADPVSRKQAGNALYVANKLIKRATKRGEALWEIIKQQRQPEAQ